MLNRVERLFSSSSAGRDLVLIAVLALCLGAAAAWLDAFEAIWNLTRAHDAWQLDEAFTMLMFLPPALAAFALRRWSQLRAEVRRRTVAEKALKEARDAAESANRAKSDFLANMSHEIRTPMNGIIGMTELALDTALTRQQRDYLESVRNSAENLLVIVNDILDFSRIESGKLVIDSITFNLQEQLQNCMREIAVLAQAKGLEIMLDVERGVPERVVGDPVRVKQILINLLGNAVKFTERGEIVARIRVAAASPGFRLRFEISDSGIGLMPEKLERIFDAFSQADASITRRFGGTGLGLSISTRLVKLMGGHIAVESRPNAGSTFRVELPFEEAEPAVVVEGSASLEQLRGTRILIVDDNATNRKILTVMLEEWGFVTQAASGGQEALVFMSRAQENGTSFPVVLTDFQMPDMDGLTLASLIKSNAKLCSATVLMLSSADRNRTLTEMKRLGISAYLTKPIIRSELEEALVHVFGLSRAGAVLRTQTAEPPPDGPRLRILVAEDNLVNQKVVQGFLKKIGHEIVIVPNGAEAVEQAKTGAFDAIVMDVQMPVCDGLEASRLIRLHESLHGLAPVPIVGLTASAMKSDEEACRHAGMDGYVSKPYKPRQLSAEIARVLQLHGRAETSARTQK